MVVGVSELGAPLPARLPFEGITEWDMGSTMAWAGKLGEVVVGVAATIEGQTPLSESFWQPARLVRAIIDTPRSLPNRPQLIHDATLVAMEVYAGVSDGDGLERLSQKLERLSLLDREVEQTHDKVSLHGTDPVVSKISADELTTIVSGPVLMVAICHGGLASGLQTLLYRAASVGSDDVIYPVRFSREKHEDLVPRLGQDEETILRDAADGRTIVVWDEDACTGQTMKEMMTHLDKHVKVKAPLVGMINFDMRDDTEIATLGTYWEHYGAR